MSIEVGSKLQGKVTGITNFGAFVELPEGLTGLVHISEVADNYVKDINDHLKVGDQVEVKLLMLKRWKDWFIYQKAKEREKQKEIVHVVNTNAVVINNVLDVHNVIIALSTEIIAVAVTTELRKKHLSKDGTLLKDSEDRLTSLKRNTESKRGGRGASRIIRTFSF